LTKQLTLVTIVIFEDKLNFLIVVGAIVGMLVNNVDSIEEAELSVLIEVRVSGSCIIKNSLKNFLQIDIH
jgi:hypothetical protein